MEKKFLIDDTYVRIIRVFIILLIVLLIITLYYIIYYMDIYFYYSEVFDVLIFKNFFIMSCLKNTKI